MFLLSPVAGNCSEEFKFSTACEKRYVVYDETSVIGRVGKGLNAFGFIFSYSGEIILEKYILIVKLKNVNVFGYFVKKNEECIFSEYFLL